MQELNYRLSVWRPNGTFLRQILRDASFITGEGLGLPLTPEGDAGEGRFRARGGAIPGKPEAGTGIQIPPLHAVQVEYNNLGTWFPIYYGEVRQGGNLRDVNGERFVLRSLRLRLGEVTLSEAFTTPQQPAHLTVRAALQDVIGSGQLGTPSVIVYDEARIPDLGFDCKAIENAHNQNPLALLENIKQQGLKYGVNVRFGVGPDRAFFCRVAKSDTLILTDADLSRPPEWKVPVAETPCTAVLWFVAKKPTGDWLTHLSENAAASALYGRRVKPVTIQNVPEAWEAIPGTYTFLTAGWPPVYAVKSPQPAIDAAVLTDGAAGTNAPNVVLSDTTRFVMLQLTASDMQRVVVQGASDRNGTLLGQKTPGEGAFLWSDEITRGSAVQGTFYPEPGRAVFLTNAGSDPADPDQTLRVSEFRPERVNTALLDDLAKSHYSLPASDPADITLRNFLAPTSLAGQVTLGTYTRPVDMWEFRITTARGLEVAALTGQAEKPEALALASLIKARDGKATIDALTAQQ